MHARLPERPKGADCKSVGFAYVGSNPSSGTSIRITPLRRDRFTLQRVFRMGVVIVAGGGVCVWFVVMGVVDWRHGE